MSSSTETPKSLPRKVQILLIGNMLSAIGNGLVLPYVFIYFHNVRGIPASVAGIIVGYSAFASLLVSPKVGSLIDHWGPRPILLNALVISALGYASLAWVRNIPEAFLAMTICAVGQSAMWPAQGAIQAELTPEHQRERIYGANFAMLNLGIGIGGVISSAIVQVAHPHSFQILYWGDGISFLVYGVIVMGIGNVGHRTEHERAANAALESGWRDVIADKIFRRFWVIAFFALLCGYSQLEVGFASFSTLVAHLPASDIAYAYAANCIMIASFQLYIVKRTEKWKRSHALAIATTFWLFAWVALSFAGVDRRHALFFIILCQIIFGIGEMVWSPIFPSITNQLAPDHLRGRYNAASTNAWQFALIVGPMFAGTLLGAGLHWIWIGGLVGGMGVVTLFALRLKLPDRPSSTISA